MVARCVLNFNRSTFRARRFQPYLRGGRVKNSNQPGVAPHRFRARHETSLFLCTIHEERRTVLRICIQQHLGPTFSPTYAPTVADGDTEKVAHSTFASPLRSDATLFRLDTFNRNKNLKTVGIQSQLFI